jgi:putative acetyltransferase
MSPITIQHLTWAHPTATALREAQQLEIDSFRPRHLGIKASAANVPIFLVAFADSEPVGCGGLRPLSSQGLPGQAEVKRMYVVPDRRGASSSGEASVALLILETLEKVAVENGWVTLKVETSLAMVQARRFYVKHGYVQCELFGAYRGAENADQLICYEKKLA